MLYIVTSFRMVPGSADAVHSCFSLVTINRNQAIVSMHV